MRKALSTGLVLAAALTLALPSLASARRHDYQDQSQDQSQDSSDQAFPQWGVGAAYLPSADGALNALTLTYRPNTDLALDGLLLGGFGSEPAGGTNSSGQAENDSVGSFGLGAQIRYSLLHPTKFLAFQTVGRLSYVTESDTHPVLGDNVSGSTGQLALFVGAGFEGFIPSWKSVSVEVNSGLNILITSASEGGTSTNGEAVALGSSNQNAFVPFNLAVHYYF